MNNVYEDKETAIEYTPEDEKYSLRYGTYVYRFWKKYSCYDELWPLLQKY